MSIVNGQIQILTKKQELKLYNEFKSFYKKHEISKTVKNNKLTKKIQQENNKTIRRQELEVYLKNLGLPGVRSDSVLCENYINNGDLSGFTLKQVADICAEMHFYYTKTDYSSLLGQIRYDNDGCYSSSSDSEDFDNYDCDFDCRYRRRRHYNRRSDEDNVREEAKSQALLNFVKKYKSDKIKMLEIPYNLREKAMNYSSMK